MEGREVVVKFTTADSSQTLRGTLDNADDARFTVQTDSGPHELSYDDVINAKTVFRWEKTPKPGH